MPSCRARPAAPDPAPDRAQFVADLWPHAEAASAATGIPAHFLVAQAALETGWGEKVLKNAQGMSSYNVFNLKAGSRWDGPTLSLPVREYAEGAPVTEHATFRMYGSYADAFADYARLLTQAPRYAAVLGQREAADFARTLHQAGFATDPGYAAKLERIITGPTLRQGAPATS
ncbi:MAG: flagellar assembly peptidoglycan hydrolase FlgJ [Gammaproteobacteria bacterium]|nr:flagellar assembly peptidoglycan hydrolase FlgJ [Gammaproteobacteria bacterium]